MAANLEREVLDDQAVLVLRLRPVVLPVVQRHGHGLVDSPEDLQVKVHRVDPDVAS
jgi:hypothetical protein